MLTELQNRGVKDIFIACVDGLSGLPEAIETVYPQTRVQLCMVHLMSNSLRYVSYEKAIPGSQKQHNMTESAFTVIYFSGTSLPGTEVAPITNQY